MDRTQVWASGGGVQSAAIAALIVLGELRPDMCVIIDTEREQSTTWDYMDNVIVPALTNVGGVLHRVCKSEFEQRDLYGGKEGKTLLIPAFTTKNGHGKLQNFCSSHWKRDVIKRWLNSQGVKAVDTWLGISTDEFQRMQQPRPGKWGNRYPLIELGLSRRDCVELVKFMGWPPAPRSSCYHCPNHTEQEWKEIRLRPKDWGAVLLVEQEIRNKDPDAFLHHSCVPLANVDFSERNNIFFSHDCVSGHCFV